MNVDKFDRRRRTATKSGPLRDMPFQGSVLAIITERKIYSLLVFAATFPPAP
jgi:hypothetical protein